MATLKEARAVKTKVKERLRDAKINGIGIERVGEGFGIKVTLLDAEERDAEDVDGVPVTFVHGGRIVKR